MKNERTNMKELSESSQPSGHVGVLFSFSSMKDQIHLFFEKLPASVEVGGSLVEDEVISNFPNAPSTHDDNLHEERNLEFAFE